MNKEVLSFMKLYFWTCHITSYNMFDSDSLARYVLYWCFDGYYFTKGSLMDEFGED